MKINSTKSAEAHVRETHVFHETDTAQALLDTMTQLGDASLGESGMAHSWPMQLKAVVTRVQRMSCLDTMGQALAMQAYMIGIAMGLYGAQSAIVQGLNTHYQSTAKAYRTRSGRKAHRIFEALMAAGELEGRERLGQFQFSSDEPHSVDFKCWAEMAVDALPMMSSSYH
jgi:hypothetical protein